ncbi:thioredoxin family protein [Thermoproteota archaeon]
MKLIKHTYYLILIMILVLNSGCNADMNKKPTRVSLNSKIQKEEKITTPTVTFIELGSVNCVPCKMMQPIMDEIEKEYKEKVKIIFYDVWTLQGKKDGQKYGIRVIPTQVFLDKNGKEFFRHEGFFSKDELVKVLKSKGL